METYIDITHEECRHKVCIICYKKAQHPPSETQLETIKDHVLVGFTLKNHNFPAGLCIHCNVLLSIKKNNTNTPLPTPENYNPNRPKNLRSSTKKCNCKICKVARGDNCFGSKLKHDNKPKRGRPKISDVSSVGSSRKICATCYSEVHKGKSHICFVQNLN